MAPEGVDEPGNERARVPRGFEALVDEESLFPSTPPVTKPAVAVPKADADASSGPPAPPAPPMVAPSPPRPADGGPPPESDRLERLEERVRQTMDRLTELVEAQLPESVDGLRSDLEALRSELQATLEQAAGTMADERRQLRAQIATTVGAANRWFVRTRDQLYERLDQIAEVASDAQAQAELAATAAAAAATSPLPPPAPPPSPPPSDAAFPAGPDATEERSEFEEVGVEWDVEDGARSAPPPAARRPASPDLQGVLDPVRVHVQELQTEVADLRAAVVRLEKRMARSKPVKLDPSQIELIVEALVLAQPEPSAPAPSPPAPRLSKATKASKPTKATKASKATKATTTKATRAMRTTRATNATKAPRARATPFV